MACFRQPGPSEASGCDFEKHFNSLTLFKYTYASYTKQKCKITSLFWRRGNPKLQIPFTVLSESAKGIHRVSCVFYEFITSGCRLQNPECLCARIQILCCSFYSRRTGFRQLLRNFESIVSGAPTTTGQTASCSSPVHMTAWQPAGELQAAPQGVTGRSSLRGNAASQGCDLHLKSNILIL